jgi:hypothetical protein
MHHYHMSFTHRVLSPQLPHWLHQLQVPNKWVESEYVVSAKILGKQSNRNLNPDQFQLHFQKQWESSVMRLASTQETYS